MKNMAHKHRHPTAVNAARATRLVMAALDMDTDAYIDMLDAVMAEFDDCRECRRVVIAELAKFGADRIRRSAAPERWDNWLTARIAKLLDHAAPLDESDR
jgi:hypothetical protein